MRSRPHLLLSVGSALLVALAAGGVARADSEGTVAARSAYTKAEDYWRKGDFKAARIELLNAIKADPNWADARVAQAETLLQLGDGLAAEAELRRAMELGKRPAELRHLMGHALQLQGQFNRAKQQLMADDIPPGNAGYAAQILARVAMAQDESDLAAQAFDRAVQLVPNDPELWIDIARFRGANGNQAGATDAAARALQLAPADADALLYRGILLRDEFGLRAALPWFERGLQIAPDNVDLLFEYGATLGEVGRNRDMLIAVRRAMELSPKHPRGYFLQAALAARAGQFKLAQNLLLQMEGAMDDVPAVMLLQGIVAQGDGNHNLAIETLRKLLARQPDNTRARTLLGRALYMAGDSRAVVDLLKGPVNRRAADVYSLWLIGQALEALSALPEAVGVLNRAARHQGEQDKALPTQTPLNVLRSNAIAAPNDARTMIPYLRALYDAGERQEAYGHAQRLQRSNMGTVDAHLLAADAAMGVGNYGAAINALTDARRLRFTRGVMLRLVAAYEAIGQDRAAGDVLSYYLAFNPADPEALRLLAYGYLRNDRPEAARMVLEKLRSRLGSGDALLLAALTEAQLRSGEAQAAEQTGRLAYLLQPASPVVTHIAGEALLEEGAKQSALDLLEKAAAIAPGNMAFQRSYDRARAVAGRANHPRG